MKRPATVDGRGDVIISIGVACLVGLFAVSGQKMLIVIAMSGTFLLLFSRFAPALNQNKVVNFIAWVVLLGVIFVPGYEVTDSLPKIRLEEALLPVVAVCIPFLERRRLRASDYLFLVLLVSPLLSIAYMQFSKGVYPSGRDFYELTKVVKYWLLLRFTRGTLSSDASYRVVMKLFAVASILLLGISIAQYLNFANINDWIGQVFGVDHNLESLMNPNAAHRVIGMAQNPNLFGAMMMILFIATLSDTFVSGPGLLRFVGLFAALSCIFITQSRTALVATCIASVGVSLLALRKSNRNGIFSFVALVGIVVAVFPWLINLQSFFYLREFLQSGLATNSLSERFQLWQDAVGSFRESPVFGWGPGKALMTTVVDNEYILVMRRYGVVGLIPLLTLYWHWLWNAARPLLGAGTRRVGPALAVSLAVTGVSIGVLTFNVTATMFYSLQIMPLYIILVGIMEGKQDDEETEKILA